MMGETATASRQSKEAADHRRRDLLDAAYSLIAEKGIEGLRTRDIAARAGVNISTLHYYFGTKEKLLVALIEDVSNIFKGAAPKSEQSASNGLRSQFAGAADVLEANPHLATVLLELLLRAKRDRAARAAFRSVLKNWNAKVESALGNEPHGGRMRADMDPHAAAFIVTSFIMGARMQMGVSAKASDFGAAAEQLMRWIAR